MTATIDDRDRLLMLLRLRAGQLIRFAAATGDWQKTTGPRGGTIWVHSGTGARRYQKNKPTHSPRVAKDHPAAVKPAAPPGKAKAVRTRANNYGKPEVAKAAAMAKPATDAAAPKAEAVKASVMDAVTDALKNDPQAKSDGLVSVKKLREAVAKQFGPAAATPEALDEVIVGLWREGKLKLTPGFNPPADVHAARIKGDEGEGAARSFAWVELPDAPAKKDPAKPAAPKVDYGKPPAPEQTYAVTPKTAAPLLEHIAKEGSVDLAQMRGAVAQAMPGKSFDEAILALNDAGLIQLSRDYSGDNPDVASKPYVKEGEYTFTSATPSNEMRAAVESGKLPQLLAKALGGAEAAPEAPAPAKPAAPKAKAAGMRRQDRKGSTDARAVVTTAPKWNSAVMVNGKRGVVENPGFEHATVRLDDGSTVKVPHAEVIPANVAKARARK